MDNLSGARIYVLSSPPPTLIKNLEVISADLSPKNGKPGFVNDSTIHLANCGTLPHTCLIPTPPEAAYLYLGLGGPEKFLLGYHLRWFSVIHCNQMSPLTDNL